MSHDVAEGIRLICALFAPCVMFSSTGPMLGTVFFLVSAQPRRACDIHRTCRIGLCDRNAAVRNLHIPLRGWYAVEDTRTSFIITVIYNFDRVMPLTLLLFAFRTKHSLVRALALAYVLLDHDCIAGRAGVDDSADLKRRDVADGRPMIIAGASGGSTWAGVIVALLS